MRRLGIEEELLLVDRESGRPLSVAQRVLDRADRAGQPAEGGNVEAEFQRQQIETGTPPREELADLDDDLRAWRDLTIAAARKEGARVIASGTSPVAVAPEATPDPRYQQMVEKYGRTSADHLSCGCHVHVDVESDEEAVGVLDRIRVWLPSLLAISANSPYWQDEDTGYASFRSQLMIRWPSAGPYGVFGSAARYHEAVDGLVATGVLLDTGMVYFDARYSAKYRTVEIRSADVCMDARDAVLVAGLCRGLVETAAAEWAEGKPAPEVRTEMLRLASWQAGRDGVDGHLLDPYTGRPRPAAEVLEDLVEHVRPALVEAGDEGLVKERLDRVLGEGNGAGRQRAMLERTNRLSEVVAAIGRVTAGEDA
jgi:glutamate---cysteine ligase / carboxylate-amine ligase